MRDDRKSNINAANAVTAMRILSVPVIAYLLCGAGKCNALSAFIVFAVASMSDTLDGWLARRSGTVTALGKLMDPLADKLMACTLLILMAPMGFVPAWMAAIITAREIAVTALRGAAAAEGIVISASDLGKAKTLLLNLAIGFLILKWVVPHAALHDIGVVMLWSGAIVSVASGADYTAKFASGLYAKESA